MCEHRHITSSFTCCVTCGIMARCMLPRVLFASPWLPLNNRPPLPLHLLQQLLHEAAASVHGY